MVCKKSPPHGRPMRRRRLFPLLAAAALSGPGGAWAGKGLTLWTMQLSPFHDDYVRALLARFEARHPGVKVHWVDVPWAEMERKTLAAAAAGTAPDVVNLNPQFAARLAELGALRDPRGFLSAQRLSDYVPAAWEANRLGDGAYFGLPWYLSTTVTVYHRGLLERAGTAVPLTPAQLLPAAQAIRRHTDAHAWFPALDGAAPLELCAALHGRLFGPDGCSLSRPDAGSVDMLAFMAEMHARSLLPPSVLTEGHRGAVARFAAGQVAMIGTGMQFLDSIRRNQPALHAQLGVAPQLSGAASDSPGAQPNIAAMNLVVPSASRHPELAFALAAYITEAQPQLELVRRVPLLPSSRTALADPMFQRTGGDALLDAARALSHQQVLQGRVQVPAVRHYQKLRTSFVRGLHAAMAGRASAAQARRDIDRQWHALRACTA